MADALPMNRNAIIAALTAGALLAPAAGAAAKKPEAAKGKAKAEQVKAQAKAKTKAKKGKQPKKAKKVKVVTYVLSGVYQGADTVLVKNGNSAVRKAGLRGDLLVLDWSAAAITVDDVDGDGVAGIADVQVGDKVLVQFRAPSVLADGATYKARKLVDQTNPPVEDEEDEDVDAPADETEDPADVPAEDDLLVEDLPEDETGDGE